MKKISFWLLLTIPLWLVSCVRDPEMESGGFKFALRSITSFQMTSFYNGDKLGDTFVGTINESQKTISLSLPAHLVIQYPDSQACSFTPSILFSRNAKITPNNLESISLKFNPQPSDSLIYTVISEDGRKAEYTLRWKYDYVYTKANILCYEFPDVIDPTTGKRPLRTTTVPITLKYPKSWFTYSTPALLDKYGDEIASIKMRIILANDSRNATIIQPVASEALSGISKFLQNPTRMSLTDPFDCNRNSKLPLYKFTVKSEDGKTNKSYTFTMDWNTAL